MKIKKIIALIVCLIISLSFSVGCNLSGDDEFKKDFASALNTRWTEVDKDKEAEGKEAYFNIYNIIKKEYDTLAPYKDKEFKDKSLKSLFTEYYGLLEEQLRLYKKGYTDKLDGDDITLMDSVYGKRIEIIKKLHDGFGIEFDKKLYENTIKLYEDNKANKKLFATRLSEEDKKSYVNLENFDSLAKNEKDLIDKTFVVNGTARTSTRKVGSTSYINFLVNGDYDNEMFIYFEDAIPEKNIQEGDKLRIYFIYKGMANSYSDNDTVIGQLPEGISRLIEFR